MRYWATSKAMRGGFLLALLVVCLGSAVALAQDGVEERSITVETVVTGEIVGGLTEILENHMTITRRGDELRMDAVVRTVSESNEFDSFCRYIIERSYSGTARSEPSTEGRWRFEGTGKFLHEPVSGTCAPGSSSEYAISPTTTLDGVGMSGYYDGHPWVIEDARPILRRQITLELSGQRLAKMRRDGGIGAVIPLIGDERFGLTATGDDGAIREDYLSEFGRVLQIGASVSGADGADEVVSVTILTLFPGEETTIDGITPALATSAPGRSEEPQPVPSLEPPPSESPTPTAVPMPSAEPPASAEPAPSSEPTPTTAPTEPTSPQPIPTPELISTPIPASEPSVGDADAAPIDDLAQRAGEIIDALPPEVFAALAGEDGAVSAEVGVMLVTLDRFVQDLAGQDTANRRAQTVIGPEDVQGLLRILDRDGRVESVELESGRIALRVAGVPTPVDIELDVSPDSGLLFFRFSAADRAAMRIIAPEAEAVPALATAIIDALATSAGLILEDATIDEDGITIQARPAE